MAVTLSLNARYRNMGQERHELLALPVPQTAMLMVDTYYDNQPRGDWGDPADPLVPQFRRMEDSIATALAAGRRAGLQVVHAMNSAPRIALERSAFAAHYARSWSRDGSLETFNREFAEGGVDAREYEPGPAAPLKIAPRLAPLPGELYIRKHVYSAFFDSRLDTALRNLGIRTLVCAGLWANVCLGATALDALYRNYTVIWLRDGTLAGETAESLAGLENTRRWIAWFEEVIGLTVTSAELAAACREISG